jgi:Ser/Thr protein kinase RdoA (MazF antagonist)
MNRIIESELIGQARRAASEIAKRLGAGQAEPVFLHRSRHISVLLPSMATVARILVDNENCAAERLRRELSVARHLFAKQAPIVAPSQTYAAGPHVQDKFVMTLWPYVEHDAFDDENEAHIASAANALRQVHEALADYPYALPDYRHKIDTCGALLADELKLRALADSDRNFLLDIYRRLGVSLASIPIHAGPIHGDAHTGNVFMTSAGARWTDFESASMGPREWDICWMPDITAFEPIDHHLHAVLADLRSICVSVWCWALADIPEKREAAEYHLNRLKLRYAP